MPPPLRLLIVEDSEDDTELVRLELERANLEVKCKRVETEEEFAAALDEPWDVIISDFRMPQFDGLRAFALYKERGIDTPFVFVSGALGEERAVEAMRAGARDYLLKGNLARLSAVVKREIAEARNRAAQREAEAASLRGQRRLAMAVEASGAGIFECTLPLGADAYLSDRWARILGFSREELPAFDRLGTWILGRLHPDDLEVVRNAYHAFIHGQADRSVVEFRLRNKQERWTDVACFASAVGRSDEGTASHVVGVMLDLTDRRKLEAELRQAQKMEAVGRLAGGIAHDFNNLLTVITSFGTFVLESLREPDPTREDMQEVLNAARKAAGLTAQLLAFSRRKPISPMVLNINSLVDEMDRMLGRVVGGHIEIATRLSPDLWNVHIDQGSLEQVIVNLAVNARDALIGGGTLTVETHNADLDAAYELAHGRQVPAGEYVVLAISDDGIGMDEATQRQIFEPFFTTKPAAEGTGLGLSTCYGIVKQAGGYIWVYSELGSGTTFEIYLPRVRRAVEAPRMSRAPEDLRGTETILVAEDDAQVRRVAIRGLSRKGYRIIEASSGGEVLLMLDGSDEKIDLLLTDIIMPEIGGLELAKRVLQARPGIKVLYMSGYTPNAIANHGGLEQTSPVLQKPFTPDSLAQKVREVLDQ